MIWAVLHDSVLSCGEENNEPANDQKVRVIIHQQFAESALIVQVVFFLVLL